MRSTFVRTVLLGTTATLIAGTTWSSPLAAAPIHGPSAVVGEETNRALTTLGSSVQHLSDPRALETAFHAYYAYQAAHPDDVKKPYLYFVDFGQSQGAQRGYVFDMKSLTLVDGPFTVAQGGGSGSGVPTRFSNVARSRATSLGLYVTGNSYAFTGHNGGHPYGSVAVRLNGKSTGYNDNALARGVVAHGAPYVTANGSGHSAGCPAMELSRAQRLVPTLANGSVVFLFAPNAEWMAHDPWVQAAIG
jgi:hypothetical protein